jgi:hypothetical protein
MKKTYAKPTLTLRQNLALIAANAQNGNGLGGSPFGQRA